MSVEKPTKIATAMREEPEELICGESYDHPDLMILQDDEEGFYAICRKCDAEVSN